MLLRRWTGSPYGKGGRWWQNAIFSYPYCINLFHRFAGVLLKWFSVSSAMVPSYSILENIHVSHYSTLTPSLLTVGHLSVGPFFTDGRFHRL